jgi:hypothetical protein
MTTWAKMRMVRPRLRQIPAHTTACTSYKRLIYDFGLALLHARRE